MKKLITSILAVGVMTGGALGQNPASVTNNGQNTSTAAKPAATAPVKPVAASPAKPGTAPAAKAAPMKSPMAPRAVIAAKPEKKPVAKVAAPPSAAAAAQAPAQPSAPKPEDKKWSMSGRRDPFFSPVVQAVSGSGCSTGKKCLDIGQINVRGVVKSEGGFIAVVTNGLNKAYFLRENDPVFNGYVTKITGDTVVFQETLPDKLGKPETHEVVKRILTPAV